MVSIDPMIYLFSQCFNITRSRFAMVTLYICICYTNRHSVNLIENTSSKDTQLDYWIQVKTERKLNRTHTTKGHLFAEDVTYTGCPKKTEPCIKYATYHISVNIAK